MAWDTNAKGRGGRHWHQTTRPTILHRDRGTCQLCGTVCAQLIDGRWVGGEVDHITRPQDGGTDHPTNLRTLCRRCHNQRTQQQAAEGRRRNQRRRTPEPHPGLRPPA